MPPANTQPAIRPSTEPLATPLIDCAGAPATEAVEPEKRCEPETLLYERLAMVLFGGSSFRLALPICTIPGLMAVVVIINIFCMRAHTCHLLGDENTVAPASAHAAWWQPILISLCIAG